MPELRARWAMRLRKQLPSILSGALILAGLGGIAGWLAESPQMGAYFIGGLAAALLLLAAIAWLLLRGLKLFVRWSPLRLPMALRHGMANIYRPDARAPLAGPHAWHVLIELVGDPDPLKNVAVKGHFLIFTS